VNWCGFAGMAREVDVRLPGKGNSKSHGARPVHLIITMINWIRTGGLTIKKSLSLAGMTHGLRMSVEGIPVIYQR